MSIALKPTTPSIALQCARHCPHAVVSSALFSNTLSLLDATQHRTSLPEAPTPVLCSPEPTSKLPSRTVDQHQPSPPLG